MRHIFFTTAWTFKEQSNITIIAQKKKYLAPVDYYFVYKREQLNMQD